jgi:outer membrane lipoprotein SlyB
MDLRQVGLGALSLAASGAILASAGVPEGRFLVAVSGAVLAAALTGALLDRTDDRQPV